MWLLAASLGSGSLGYIISNTLAITNQPAGRPVTWSGTHNTKLLYIPYPTAKTTTQQAKTITLLNIPQFCILVWFDK